MKTLFQSELSTAVMLIFKFEFDDIHFEHKLAKAITSLPAPPPKHIIDLVVVVVVVVDNDNLI